MSYIAQQEFVVSTHSRPKAAGKTHYVGLIIRSVSTHSRPKAAGIRMLSSK